MLFNKYFVNNKQLSKVKFYCFFFIYSFVVLFFCCGASPIIKQIFGDIGCYIYYGRRMYNGILPFVNSPEMGCKGIYTWFVNYFGTLITPNSVTGNYIVEAVFKSIDLCILFSIFNLFFKSNIKSFFASLLFFAIMLSRPCYVFGNQNEQYQFTGIIASIYILLKFNFEKLEDKDTEFQCKYMLVLGILFAYVFCFKMNYVLAFVPIPIIIIGDMLLRKKVLLSFKTIIFGIIGVTIGVFPGLAYIINNNLLKTFYERCFLQVKNGYGDPVRLNQIFAFFFHLKTIWIFPLIFFSIYIVLKSKRIIKLFKYLYVCMFLSSLIACIISGHVFSIYHYQLYPYILPFAYFLINLFYEKKVFIISKSFLFLLGLFLLTILLNMNIILSHIPNFKLSTFGGMKTMNEFSDIINSKVSYKNYKMYACYPQFYVLQNTIDAHLEYVYYPNTNLFINNVEHSIKSLENDVLLLTYDEIDKYNIENFLDEYYILCVENQRWRCKGYIKKKLN